MLKVNVMREEEGGVLSRMKGMKDIFLLLNAMFNFVNWIWRMYIPAASHLFIFSMTATSFFF